MGQELGLALTPVRDLEEGANDCNVWVTCTTSRRAFLKPGHVAAGSFVAAVGADNPEKSELEPELMAQAKVVADLVEQCASMGDLHHALAAGVMTRANVHAELHEVVSGRKPGRTTDAEITIFDSTGTALQDAAAAIRVYEKAVEKGLGTVLDFAA